MAYKTILVYLDQGRTNEVRVDSALAMARLYGAALTGVVVTALPNIGSLKRLGVSGSDAMLDKAREAAEATAAAFLERCKAAGVEAESSVIECSESQAPARLSRLARVHDISIVRQSNPDHDNAALVAALSEEVMLSSGRPVIFMPYIGAHDIPFAKGLIAWDGSRAATRAVHDALPLLEKMDDVIIMVIESEKFDRSPHAEPGERLVRHLKAHGVDSKVMRVSKGEISTSSVILNEISNTGADLLVMGGYGTPKLREIILGGVTKTVLGSMTVPVLMSH
jgi:nucleotide-binding universal stress UspA family protein